MENGANNDQVSNEALISEIKRNRWGDTVISIKSKLEQLPAVNKECKIYRVPKLLCQMKKTAYVPQVNSIGPFHHGSNDLNATEPYKLQGLRNFLRRLDNNKEKSLEKLVKIARSWIEEARSCYADPIDMDDYEFVKMMLVDGCFIVEFFILVYNQYTTSDDHKFPQIDPNADLLFYQGIIPDMYFDLIKLENQLPFFILQRLFELMPKENNPKSLIPDNEFSPISFLELIYEFLRRLGWVENYVQLGEKIVWSEFDPKHLVDFLRLFYISSSDDECRDDKKINILSFFDVCRRFCNMNNKETSEKTKVHVGNREKPRTHPIFNRTYSREYWTKAKKNNLLSRASSCFGWNKKKHEEDDHEEKMWIPPSITELSEAGVTVKKAKKSTFITNIAFKDGVMEIPPIVIDDYFETVTRNLIAYEHLEAKYYQEMNVVSYILLDKHRARREFT